MRSKWEVLDQDGVTAGHRWFGWVYWSFGWFVRNPDATQLDFEKATDAWWVRTRGGGSRDAVRDPKGTHREVMRWARSRGKQLREDMDRPEDDPLKIRPIANRSNIAALLLTDDQRDWIVRRATHFDVSKWVAELIDFAGWLYAREKVVPIHVCNVLRPMVGRRYQEFRKAAAQVFDLTKVGGYRVGRHAQKYERGVELEEMRYHLRLVTE